MTNTTPTSLFTKAKMVTLRKIETRLEMRRFGSIETNSQAFLGAMLKPSESISIMFFQMLNLKKIQLLQILRQLTDNKIRQSATVAKFAIVD